MPAENNKSGRNRPMKLKPRTPSGKDVDGFIQSAKADVLGYPSSPAVPATTAIPKSDEEQNKRLQQTSTSHVNIGELVGRGGMFAATFKRETYYVHKDLVKALNKKAAKGGKGEKTRIINLALQAFLESEGEKQ